MARVSPFPFEAIEEIQPHRIVTADPATGEVKYPAIESESNGITVGERTAQLGEVISVQSSNNVTETFLVECGATIAKGDPVSGDIAGKAIVDSATGIFIALQDGIVGQLINVISIGAF